MIDSLRAGRLIVHDKIQTIADGIAGRIPIPQALDSLGEEKENPAFGEIVLKIADSVRKGAAFSTALEEHPRLFSKLYVSMVRVGEEAGQLAKVMNDLANLLEILLDDFDGQVGHLLDALENIQTAAAAVALHGVGGIGYELEFAQHELGNDNYTV